MKLKMKKIRPVLGRFPMRPGMIVGKLKAGYKVILARRAKDAQEENMRLLGIPQYQYYQQFFPQYQGQQGGKESVVEKERIVEKIIEKSGGGGDRDEKERELDKSQYELVEIPEGFTLPAEGEETAFPFIDTGKGESREGVNISYPLIPRDPKRGETIYAYAILRWEPDKGQVIYNVIEPDVSQNDLDIIEKAKRRLEEILDVDFYKLGPVRAKDMLRGQIENILTELEILDPEERRVIIYYIERDIIGYEKLEPLMNDPNIEDISCDGVGIPIFVYHRDPKLGSLRSNIMFTTHDELNDFVVRLAQKSKKSITIAEPLLDASLPDGSRVQATLGTDIARKGSNFTIRKFTERPLTPAHMLLYRTLDSTQLAYLWMAIEHGQSVLVSGGTATGKTSLLNVLSLFIRPNLKIVSIEDTPELRLPHPHWIPHVARTPLTIKRKTGEVTLFDLLKSSLRQRPDYIIVGEVRGKEAFVLFQQIATGHAGISTIHAASMPQLIDRLTTPPISLPPTLIENINVIVFLVLARLKGKYVRRTDSIVEVVGVRKDRPVTRTVFKWNPSQDTFEISEKSVIMEYMAKRLGMAEDAMRAEIARRKRILEWMAENSILDYRDVAKIISLYYSDPSKLLNIISGSSGENTEGEQAQQ